MGFFGIGAGEIFLILIVALLIFGPRRLPEIARTLGRTVRALKKTTYDLTSEVTKEIDISKDIESKGKDNPSQPKQKSGIKSGKPQN